MRSKADDTLQGHPMYCVVCWCHAMSNVVGMWLFSLRLFRLCKGRERWLRWTCSGAPPHDVTSEVVENSNLVSGTSMEIHRYLKLFKMIRSQGYTRVVTPSHQCQEKSREMELGRLFFGSGVGCRTFLSARSRKETLTPL